MNETQSPPANAGELLDEVLPEYEFSGKVSIPVRASGAELFRALFEVKLDDIPIAAVLGAIRYLPGRLVGRHPPAASKAPFMEQLLSTGNAVLAELPGRELVLGAIGKFHQVLDQEPLRVREATQFRAFADERYQKLAMSIRVEEGAGGRRLVLEHRTHALGSQARQAFAGYWLVIKPMGNYVSWLLLRAVRRRAERKAFVQATQSR